MALRLKQGQDYVAESPTLYAFIKIVDEDGDKANVLGANIS